MPRVKKYDCDFPGCDKPHIAKGYCQGHYTQQKEGRPLKILRINGCSKEERFLWRFEHSSKRQGDCIVPDTPGDRDYPQLRCNGRSYKMSRLSYQIFNGPLNGMEVHHVCANGRCYNPEHLELVSRLANVAEMKERRCYKLRIAALEQALALADPDHKLLREG